MKESTFSTKEVAELSGVHKDTLLRWLKDGKVQEPLRDRNGWRMFSTNQVRLIKEFANGVHKGSSEVNESSATYQKKSTIAKKLEKINWDFLDANSSYLTHSIHPYPAKYIPQIPKALIRGLASAGDIILDPFCGSGTTLLEALRLDCDAIGIDANPLACLISRAKTHRLSQKQFQRLNKLAGQIEKAIEEVKSGKEFSSIHSKAPSVTNEIVFKGVGDWFDSHVIDELSFVKKKSLEIRDKAAKDIALAAMSSIIVNVSHQDSDTRYVRREKYIKQGKTLQAFTRSLKSAINRSEELSNELNSGLNARIIEANVLRPPEIDKVDLVVCSPPYPNAYSYHLYHRTRMMWLGMDQPKFKQEEIGSHRKYSSKSKNAATVDTFRGELYTILSWLKHTLKVDGLACFVIGDSILKGVKIKNDILLEEVAVNLGYRVEANINRTIQSTRKSFNPAIGKIKEEHVVILRNMKAST